jgi:hypothetical protein
VSRPRGITQLSSHITSTPPQARGLARASSPNGSIRAAGRRHQGSPPRPPDRPWWGRAPWRTADTAVATTVAATIVATPCRNPVASAAGRGGSLAAAALSALNERRLVGTEVPDLSTLVGARSGTVGAAL